MIILLVMETSPICCSPRAPTPPPAGCQVILVDKTERYPGCHCFVAASWNFAPLVSSTAGAAIRKALHLFHDWVLPLHQVDIVLLLAQSIHHELTTL
jgi:hypothetical protein